MGKLWLPPYLDEATALRAPELLVPGKKPVGPVEIDWSHPLGRSVSRCCLNGVTDIVSGSIGEMGNSAFYYKAGDLAHPGYTTTTSHVSHNYTGYSGASKQTVTLAFNDTNNTQSWAGLFMVAGVSASTHNFQLQYNAGALYALCRNGANTYGYTASVVTPNQLTFVTVVFDGSGATNSDKLKVYVNGANIPLTFVGSIPTSIHSDTTNPWRTFGNGYENLRGYIKFEIVHSDALTASAIQALHQNPYAFLKPANQTPYLISVGSGGGADYTDSLSISATSAVSVTDTYYAPPAYTDTLSTSAISAITVTDTPGATHEDSITVSAVSSITVTDTPGATHEDSITISATSAITVTDGYAAGTNYADSINVAATSAISATAIYYTPPAYTDTLSANATGSASVTETMGMAYRDDLDIVASGTITVTDLYDANADYVDSISATATAGITVDDYYYSSSGGGLTYEQWVTIQEVHAWLAELRQLKGLDAANPVSISDNGTTTSVTTGDIELHITDTGITRVS